MNKLVLEQLKQVKACSIDFNEESIEIFIPKTIKMLNTALKKGSVYLIELDDSVTHPSNDSMLASNWNNGVIPSHKMYKAEILDVMVKMIKINGIAVEDGVDIYNEPFYGWLPADGFKVIAKL